MAMTHWREPTPGPRGCVILLVALLGFWGVACFVIYYYLTN